jgi:hypothetical protein
LLGSGLLPGQAALTAGGRTVTLRSHLLVGAVFGPYADERRYAEQALAEATGQRSDDRGPSLDSKQYPAAELQLLYHERWEMELGYDEVKTDMLDRQEAIRSRTPTGVLQALYAVGLAYNLIRLEMERIAEEAKVAPSRISFVMSLRLIRDEWYRRGASCARIRAR